MSEWMSVNIERLYWNIAYVYIEKQIVIMICA